MTGCYAYCVLPAGTAPPAGQRGIDGAPVAPLDIDGVTLWVSPLAARPGATLERIRVHEAVVRAAHAVTTPVPLRFAQWFPDRTTLLNHAAGRVETWRATLTEFDGCEEFGIRIDVAGPRPARDVQYAADRPASGRAYMERLAARHGDEARMRERGDQVLGEMRSRLMTLVLRERVGRVAAAASVAHLVRREHGDAYRAAVEAYDAPAGTTITLTGPWPPYSFVE
jgi:hypothetical protein